jgi:hypothetical protein
MPPDLIRGWEPVRVQKARQTKPVAFSFKPRMAPRVAVTDPSSSIVGLVPSRIAPMNMHCKREQRAR